MYSSPLLPFLSNFILLPVPLFSIAPLQFTQFHFLHIHYCIILLNLTFNSEQTFYSSGYFLLHSLPLFSVLYKASLPKTSLCSHQTFTGFMMGFMIQPRKSALRNNTKFRLSWLKIEMQTAEWLIYKVFHYNDLRAFVLSSTEKRSVSRVSISKEL